MNINPINTLITGQCKFSEISVSRKIEDELQSKNKFNTFYADKFNHCEFSEKVDEIIYPKEFYEKIEGKETENFEQVEPTLLYIDQLQFKNYFSSSQFFDSYNSDLIVPKLYSFHFVICEKMNKNDILQSISELEGLLSLADKFNEKINFIIWRCSPEKNKNQSLKFNSNKGFKFAERMIII